MSIRVEPVRSSGELRRFIRFPWKVYRGRTPNPNWVPPLLVGERDLFNPRKNPFWAHAECQHFLAYRDREIVGRITATMDHSYIQFHEQKTAFLGFFECIDDREAAQVLFDAAVGWARDRGMTRNIGPMNPSADQILGVLIDSFDTPPIVQMGYSPSYYPALYEACGFSKEKDLYCYRMSAKDLPMSDKIRRVAELVQKKRKITLRSVDMKRFGAEVQRIRELYNSAWDKSWGFVPWTREEFDYNSNDLKLVGDPDIVLLAEVDSKLIAVSVPIPDVNQILIKMNGRLLPFGIFKLLLGRRKIDIFRMAIMGVARGYHNQGIDALLIYETYKRASASGYRAAEFSWLLEDNYDVRNLVENWGAEHYRTYRVYGKALA